MLQIGDKPVGCFVETTTTCVKAQASGVFCRSGQDVPDSRRMAGQGLPAMIERASHFMLPLHRRAARGPGNFCRVGLDLRLQLQDMGMIHAKRYTQFVVEPL